MAAVEVVDAHEHEPIRVVDDLETDEYRRPARWLWHVECYRCRAGYRAGAGASGGGSVTAAAGSGLVAALELVWEAIRRRHAEVPEVVVVVAAGSEGKSLSWGTSPRPAGTWRTRSARRSS